MTKTRPIPENSKREKKFEKKIPKRITETYLHNAGLFYLERFNASTGHFRSVMLRKVKKSCFHHKDQDYDKCTQMVDDLVHKFVKSGLLNDNLYLEGMINSYKRKGLSTRAIMQKLVSKKLPPEKIADFLEKFEGNNMTSDSEIRSAAITCRKKKIGAFTNKTETNYQKDLEKLGRAGFSYDIAKKVLEMTKDELEDIVYSGF